MTEARIIWAGKVAGECVCGIDPCSGLDCGPFLPGDQPRRKEAPKPASEIAGIRAQAWATRRAKYGQSGHNGSYSR